MWLPTKVVDTNKEFKDIISEIEQENPNIVITFWPEEFPIYDMYHFRVVNNQNQYVREETFPVIQFIGLTEETFRSFVRELIEKVV